MIREGNDAKGSPDIEQLGKLSRTVVDDPSVLNHNLRQLCALFGTEYHEKADQMMGTMIALHSSRMLSTSWTVLLQCLRETSDPRAQLTLLYHFGNIADRISIPQRTNAFRVFAKEALRLLSSIDVVVRNQSFFVRFRGAIAALGVYGEKGLSEAILEKVIPHIVTFPRTEGRRAAAQLAAQLVTSTLHCGSFTGFIEKVEMDSDLLGCCITMDASLPLLLDQAKKLSTKPTAYYTVCDAKSRIDKWLYLLIVEEPTRHRILPVVISCLEKMKQFDPTWQLTSADKIVERAITIVSKSDTKTILLSPLLNLIRLLISKQTNQLDGVWSLTHLPDPMIRFDALNTMATAAANEIEPQVAKDLLICTFDLFQKYMTAQCSYTVSGTLCLFTALTSKTYHDSSTVFHQVLRAHFDLANPVNLVSSVRIHVLQLIDKIPGVYVTTFFYVLLCAQDANVKVRNSAFTLLLKWCGAHILDEVLFRETFLRGIDFLEGYPCARLVTQGEEKSWISHFRNTTQLILYLIENLHSGTANTSKERHHIIQCSCEGLMFVSASDLCGASSSASYGLGVTLLEDTFYRAFIAVHDLILSSETFPFDTYVSLISAATSCLKRCRESTLFDIFTHKQLFNRSWNVLHRCCQAIDPMSAPKLHRERSLYLVWQELPKDLERMIASSAISGLTNVVYYQETRIFELVENTTDLFIELIRFGSCSPVFVGQLRRLYSYILDCLDILAGSNPVASLRGCRVLFETLFCNGALSDSFSKRENETSTECGRFVSMTVTILTRSLAFDLVVAGEEFFSFIKVLIEMDKRSGDSQCYLVVDGDFSLVKRMISIVSDREYYNAVRGAAVVEPILVALELLFSSFYFPRVADVCTQEEWTRILSVIDEAAVDLQSDVFNRCRDSVVCILKLYEKTSFSNSSVSPTRTRFESLFEKKWNGTEEFLLEFCLLCEGVAFGNLSEASLELGMMHAKSLPMALCACILDSSLVSRTVELSLIKESETFMLELLLVVMANIDTKSIVKSAALTVNEMVLGSNDDLVAQIIDSFRWGWVETDTTPKTLELIADSRCGFSLRRAIYEAARQNFFLFPQSLVRNPHFMLVAFSSFPQITVPIYTEDDRGELFSSAICESLADHCIGETVTIVDEEDAVVFDTTQEGELMGAMSLWPLFFPGVAQSSTLLSRFFGLENATIRGLLECISEKHAADVFVTLGKKGLLGSLRVVDMIELTRFLIRGGITSFQMDAVIVDAFLKRICYLLSELCDTSELTISLKYCSMFLLVLVAPSRESRWQDVLNEECILDGFLHLRDRVLFIIRRCLEVRVPSMDVKGIAKYVVSIFLRSPSLRQGIDESILWLVVKCCTSSVWEVIIGEELCSSSDVASLKFLCKLNQTVGLPPNLIEEMHAHYTPLLLSFGNSRQLDSDEQRLVFWLITSLLLHTVISEDRFVKPKMHMALTDALCQYTDFPLESVSSEAALSIRSLCNASIFPYYTQLPVSPNERHWNIHTTGHLLPLCGRCTPSKEVAEKILTSLLHLYAHVIISILSDASEFPVYCVSDVFFSLTTLSAGNSSLLKHTQAYEGTIVENILPCLYSWYREYAALLIDGVHLQGNVLRSHVGLLPDTNRSMMFLDGFNISTCTAVIVNLFTVGSAKIPGYIDVGDALTRMLSMDIFSYVGAVTAIIIISGSATRKELAPVASMLARRLFDDLESSAWGGLSFNFGILQILRSACSILAALPDEHISMRICEAIWNGVLTKSCTRRLEQYAYYTLQCVAHMTVVGQTQWRTLRALLNYTPKNKGALDAFPLVASQISNSEENDGSGSTACFALVRQTSLPFQKSFFASRIKRERRNLFSLSTAASLVLHGSYGEGQLEEVDHNRIQVITLLDSLHDAPSYVGDIAVAILHELMFTVLEQEDALFITFNRFDFTPVSQRLLLYALHEMSESVMRDNSKEDSRWCVIADTTRLLFGACLGKTKVDLASWWWLTCAILNSFLGIKNTDYSGAISVILAQTCSIATQRMLALRITLYLSEVDGYGPVLRVFLTELKEMCLSRSSEEIAARCVTDILTTLLQVIL
ncbi:hypothetical protein DQ04_02371090 [Trypanosoma grayi]|uniref:hypothetical protein n=1 Tax=Trypanosoma grayi TaxID=71804 RepID=UPI0004F47EF5|nr:hypothetical protein DQ04_02371090 [Trypanosoma grayi]KEG11686.1 hypothetical protein DQ04_02371090 [Trypanosoma grayi]